MFVNIFAILHSNMITANSLTEHSVSSQSNSCFQIAFHKEQWNRVFSKSDVRIMSKQVNL